MRIRVSDRTFWAGAGGARVRILGRRKEAQRFSTRRCGCGRGWRGGFGGWASPAGVPGAVGRGWARGRGPGALYTRARLRRETAAGNLPPLFHAAASDLICDLRDGAVVQDVPCDLIQVLQGRVCVAHRGVPQRWRRRFGVARSAAMPPRGPASLLECREASSKSARGPPSICDLSVFFYARRECYAGLRELGVHKPLCRAFMCARAA